MNNCTNCIYEYRCDWSKADENLTCPDWKSDGVREED